MSFLLEQCHKTVMSALVSTNFLLKVTIIVKFMYLYIPFIVGVQNQKLAKSVYFNVNNYIHNYQSTRIHLSGVNSMNLNSEKQKRLIRSNVEILEMCTWFIINYWVYINSNYIIIMLSIYIPRGKYYINLDSFFKEKNITSLVFLIKFQSKFLRKKECFLKYPKNFQQVF